MKKNRLIGILGILTLSAIIFTGCGKKEAEKTPDKPVEEVDIDDDNMVVKSPEKKENNNEGTEGTDEEITPLSVVTRKYYENYFKQGDDQENYQKIAESTAEGLEIVDEGYDELKAALAEYSENAHKGAANFSNEAKEMYSTEGSEGMGIGNWFYEAPIKLQRADSKALSFFTLDSSFSGGAHPYSFYVGYTFDSKTGKELTLEDISQDYDGLRQTVIDKIKNSENADGLFEEWQDTVNASFGEITEENSGVNWAISPTELRIIYNPYDLGPYALGMIEVRLPFDEYGNLIKSEYTNYKPQAVHRPDTEYGVYYMEFNIDTDGDEEKEVITLSSEDIYTDDYNPEIDFDHVSDFIIGMKLSAGFGNSNEEAQKNAIEVEADLSVQNAYVMDGLNGKKYLYVETSSYNDYRSLMIFDLSDPDTGLKEIPYEGGSFYGFVPMDANHFCIADRINVMGTFTGYRVCKVGEDGTPKPYTDLYTLSIDSDERTMTLSQDINGLEKGTKLVPYSSNGVDIMNFKKEDGTNVEFKYDADTVNDYPRTINGINEEEVFDTVMYAG